LFKDLHFKTALITGGSNGIGEEMVKKFAQYTKTVIVGDKDREKGEILSKLFNNVHYIELNLGSVNSIKQFVQKVTNLYSHVDILINNAAISKGDSFLETSFEKWKETIDINLNGTFYLSQLIVKEMINHEIDGKVINIASINSFASEKNASPYVASKGGINQLTKSMATDLGEYSINVNAIAPGPIKTDTKRVYFDTDPVYTGIKRGVPLGRPGAPEDISFLAIYLASNKSNFIHGETIVVDGGFTSYIRQD